MLIEAAQVRVAAMADMSGRDGMWKLCRAAACVLACKALLSCMSP